MKKYRQNILLVSILICALFLRLFNLSYMEFKGDEAFNSLKAIKFAENGNIPLTSAIGSTGIHEPPIFMYFLAIPFFFSFNPILAATLIAVINVIGLFFLYLFVNEFLNYRAALIAAVLYSVNPWQIIYSRKIWTVDILATFVILFIYFISSAVYKKKESHIIYALIALSFVLQIHLSALYFAGITLIIIFLYMKDLNKFYLIIGFIIFLLTFAPYLAFQIKNNFTDIHTALNLVKKKITFHEEAFTIPFRLVTTNGLNSYLGSDFYVFQEGFVKIGILDFFSSLLLLISIVLLFFIRGNCRIILIVWGVTGTIFMAFNKANIFSNDTHYFISFFPLYFIMMGNALSWMTTNTKKSLQYSIYTIIFMLTLYHFLFSFHLISFVKEQGCIHGDYGLPYAYHLNQVKKVISKFSLDDINTELNNIHLASCNCGKKCDFLATKFIIKYIRPEYDVGEIE